MKTRRNLIGLVCCCALLASGAAIGQVKLPKLISDGMVLQRDAAVTIWGWAPVHEKISVAFRNAVYRTASDDSGKWSVQLPHMKAGGPFTMTIIGGDTTTISNIAVGDVWVCSGQSNMELAMRRVRPLYGSEIASSDNPSIRMFTVPQKYNFTAPQADFSGGAWKPATPANVLDFSAAAYFFARELFQKYHVPIGLIHTSLGGSPAEAWMSEDALKAFPDLYAEAQRFKDTTLIVRIDDADRARSNAWYTLLHQKDEGMKDPQHLWSDPSTATASWDTMKVPGYWADTKLGAVNGVVWFKKDITLPASMAKLPANLVLGRIVDADSVFINGIFVGTTSYQYPPRWYDVPANVLKEGANEIVVRVISNIGRGGFVPDKKYTLSIGDTTIDLKGDWQYRLGAVMDPLAGQTFVRWKPLGLYNAMIAPLLNYRILGAIWYQGESNAARPAEYRTLFPAMIRNWREKWHEGDFPFLFVQLPNFMEAKKDPSESNWALLREAQAKALALPNTAMAVAIDLGEWNDIHPLNKKDVGIRLALAAEKVAYHDTRVVASGPVYRSMKSIGKKIILTFTNTGSGLTAKGGVGRMAFAIAGADHKFVWANSKIDGNTVIVWSDTVADPKAVRYAWADNPEGGKLYNREGLPAAPFRTDQ